MEARKFKAGEVRELLELIGGETEFGSVELKGLQRWRVFEKVVVHRRSLLVSRGGHDLETDIFHARAVKPQGEDLIQHLRRGKKPYFLDALHVW